MKSKQKNNKLTQIGLKSYEKSNQSDSQQLPNQINIYTNRLNYVQETITKLQRKINKLQKTITTSQQLNGEFKNQIGQKIAEMIEIFSKQQQNHQQKGNTKRIIQNIDSIRQDIKRLSKTNNSLIDKYENIEERLLKVQNVSNINKRDVKNIVEQKIIQIEKRITHQISSNISHVYEIIEGIQNKIKHNDNVLNNKIEQLYHKLKSNNSCINQNRLNIDLKESPNFSKSNLKNSYSQQKNIKISKNKLKKQSQDQNDFVSNRLQSNQNISDIFKRKTQTFQINNNILSSNKFKNTQNVPVSQNNSRVVYLRQKLKQFQDINKKYQKKQKQFQPNQSQTSCVSSQFSSSKFKSNNKDFSQVSKEIYSASNTEYERDLRQPHLSYHKKSNTQLEPERLSFQRQSQSTKKDFSSHKNPSISGNVSSSFSSSKNSYLNQGSFLNRDQSAKKIDKLKSIRDYLQQTQSEIDESLLEPNYS